MPNQTPVTVVGAGLAGCEAAMQLARLGVEVSLLEMKPARFSPAHSLPGPAELVCSNSLKSDAADTAHGLLKRELRRMGSVVLEAAERSKVSAGTALAVDREQFSQAVADLLSAQPLIRFAQGVEVQSLPEGDVVVATGPLTSASLAEQLYQLFGQGTDLYFYDALAPIVSGHSVDANIAYFASRWDKGGAGDYLNCPMTRQQYQRFVQALQTAPRTPLREFESERYFENCLPIEVMADRGEDTLAFGPMRPVGLEHQGQRHHAVVQLRPENAQKSAYNLVGFQTKLTIPAQRQVFRLIPGLEQAQFLRYGAVHRNLYINAPRVLNDMLQCIALPRVRLAGQMTGVEGYMESAAIGLLVGWLMGRERVNAALELPPPESALGALYAHLRGRLGSSVFEPMNIHFGLLPVAEGRGKEARRLAAIERAEQAFAGWMHRMER